MVTYKSVHIKTYLQKYGAPIVNFTEESPISDKCDSLLISRLFIWDFPETSTSLKLSFQWRHERGKIDVVSQKMKVAIKYSILMCKN